MKLAVFKGFENSKNGLTVERVLELADFVTTHCQAGDASGIKDLVASTIEEADEEDRELEEKVDDQVRQQANEYGLNGDGYDNEQVVENKDESKPQSNQLPSGVIDINAIDN